jgi:hypothetical protein
MRSRFRKKGSGPQMDTDTHGKRRAEESLSGYFFLSAFIRVNLWPVLLSRRIFRVVFGAESDTTMSLTPRVLQ